MSETLQFTSKNSQIAFAETSTAKGIKKHKMPRSVFLPYWRKMPYVSLIHRYLNDSQLYFEYMRLWL